MESTAIVAGVGFISFFLGIFIKQFSPIGKEIPIKHYINVIKRRMFYHIYAEHCLQ